MHKIESEGFSSFFFCFFFLHRAGTWNEMKWKLKMMDYDGIKTFCRKPINFVTSERRGEGGGGEGAVLRKCGIIRGDTCFCGYWAKADLSMSDRGINKHDFNWLLGMCFTSWAKLQSLLIDSHLYEKGHLFLERKRNSNIANIGPIRGHWYSNWIIPWSHPGNNADL